MPFRSYDSLRVFEVAARRLSFTAAAEELNLTKGAVSYQIARLEEELGFKLFERQARGVVLTEKGQKLCLAAQPMFFEMEREIGTLRAEEAPRITIGMSTYFASRWLSPRLMTFMAAHPRVRLRLQPMIDLTDLHAENIDMVIRWGRGEWKDMKVERLLSCPAFAVAGSSIAKRVVERGLGAVLPELTLLHDRDGSKAWLDWHAAAGLAYRSTREDIVIPDPNVRVQAVIDGQGLALYDALAEEELSAGELIRVSPVELVGYGYYLAYPKRALDNQSLRSFRDWIVAEGEAAGAGR